MKMILTQLMKFFVMKIDAKCCYHCIIARNVSLENAQYSMIVKRSNPECPC